MNAIAMGILSPSPDSNELQPNYSEQAQSCPFFKGCSNYMDYELRTNQRLESLGIIAFFL